MFSTMLEVLSKGAVNLTSVVLSPVDILVNNLFPNMTIYISSFNIFVSQYIGNTISYFSSMLPPMTRNVIAMWISFLIVYYTVSWTYSLILKGSNVVKKLKFW